MANITFTVRPSYVRAQAGALLLGVFTEKYFQPAGADCSQAPDNWEWQNRLPFGGSKNVYTQGSFKLPEGAAADLATLLGCSEQEVTAALTQHQALNANASATGDPRVKTIPGWDKVEIKDPTSPEVNVEQTVQAAAPAPVAPQKLTVEQALAFAQTGWTPEQVLQLLKA